jgi:hypothetical protein
LTSDAILNLTKNLSSKKYAGSKKSLRQQQNTNSLSYSRKTNFSSILKLAAILKTCKKNFLIFSKFGPHFKRKCDKNSKILDIYFLKYCRFWSRKTNFSSILKLAAILKTCKKNFLIFSKFGPHFKRKCGKNSKILDICFLKYCRFCSRKTNFSSILKFAAILKTCENYFLIFSNFKHLIIHRKYSKNKKY